MRLLTVFCLFVTGCDLGIPYEAGPWRTEVWSETPRVEVELRVRYGVPDDQTDYRVRAHGRIVIDGYLEDFDRSHAVRRLDNGSVEIAIWDRACVVKTATVVCRAIDYQRW